MCCADVLLAPPPPTPSPRLPLLLLQVLLRSWRQEPDGTYIVLYQSTNPRRAKPPMRSLFM